MKQRSPNSDKSIWTYRSQYKKVSEQEKTALAELRGVVWEMLTTVWHAEWHRKRGKERACKHSAFIANPFGFAKKLLGNYSGQLTWQEREQDLGHCAALICPPEPSTLFNINEPTLKEVREVIKSARTASPSGPIERHCCMQYSGLWTSQGYLESLKTGSTNMSSYLVSSGLC